jgi:hypothetical protein
MYDPSNSSWRGDKQQSKDWVVSRSGDRFTDLVKNTYRVLLSRGLKGCYVYFMDKNTETFVRSRIEGLEITQPVVRVPPKRIPPAHLTPLPPSLRPLAKDEVQRYVNAVPVLDLKIAAGQFAAGLQADLEEVSWVALPESFRVTKGLFVAQVVGESMNRRIPNGAWCLFKIDPVGSREGKIVIAEHRAISDADTGTNVTVKRYHSEKIANEDGNWRHARIVLLPDSNEPRYKPIELTPDQAEELRIFAEHIAVLG